MWLLLRQKGFVPLDITASVHSLNGLCGDGIDFIDEDDRRRMLAGLQNKSCPPRRNSSCCSCATLCMQVQQQPHQPHPHNHYSNPPHQPEDVANHSRSLPQVFLHEFAPYDTDKGGAGIICNGLCQHRLPLKQKAQSQHQ